MSAVTILSLVVAALGLLSGIVFNLINLNKNKNDKTATDNRELATIISDLGYIKGSIERIDKAVQNHTDEFKHLNEKINNIDNSIIEIETVQKIYHGGGMQH